MAAVVAVGAALGAVSRAVDTASWAPAWAGNVLAPWLIGAWVAGASVAVTGASIVGAKVSTASSDRAWGAAAGLALLCGTVFTYLALAGGDAVRLAPGLVLLALAAGPAMGLAGAAMRAGARGHLAAGALLGAALVADGVLLQIGDRTGLERLAMGLVAIAGLALAGWIGRWPAAGAALLIGLALVVGELAILAVLDLSLP